MSRPIAIGAASFAFLLGFGGFLWAQTGSAVFAAMIESGFLLLCG